MKLEKLTKEQELKMIEVRDFWLSQIFSCSNFLDKKSATQYVEWLYEFCGLKKPKILFVDSPLACQYAVAMLKNLQPMANVRANVRANVSASVWDNVWANVSANVWDNVRDNVRDNVSANVRDNVSANVRANVRDNVWDNVGDNVWDNVGDNESFSFYGNIGDYGWVAFYDYFTQIGVIKNNDFEQFKKLLLSGIYDMIQMDGLCVVSDMPNLIKRDSEGRLNSVESMSIQFKDGYGQYYVNGLHLPSDLFEKLSRKEIDFSYWANESNEEIKSAIISFYQQKFGDEFVFRFLSEHLKEIDTFVNKKDEKYLKGTYNGMNVGVYTLFKGMINSVEIAYVRTYDYSTDRMFFLGVEPTASNAKDAIASLCQVPKGLESDITEIRRQGEKFSFSLTEKGESLVRSKKIDFNDLISLSGDAYFSKMTYEY